MSAAYPLELAYCRKASRAAGQTKVWIFKSIHGFSLGQWCYKSTGRTEKLLQNFGSTVGVLFYLLFHQCRMLRSTTAVSPAFTHGARWRRWWWWWGVASGQVSKRGDGRWGEVTGRTRVTSFTWCWLEPVQTCKREFSLRGGKRRRASERVFRKGNTQLTYHQSFRFGLRLSYCIHLHHSISFLLLPKVIPGRWKCCCNCWLNGKKTSHFPEKLDK